MLVISILQFILFLCREQLPIQAVITYFLTISILVARIVFIFQQKIEGFNLLGMHIIVFNHATT